MNEDAPAKRSLLRLALVIGALALVGCDGGCPTPLCCDETTGETVTATGCNCPTGSSTSACIRDDAG